MISMLSGQLLYVTILLAGGINISQPRREEKRDSSTSTSTAQTCKQCLTMFGTEGGKGAFLLCTLHCISNMVTKWLTCLPQPGRGRRSPLWRKTGIRTRWAGSGAVAVPPVENVSTSYHAAARQVTFC